MNSYTIDTVKQELQKLYNSKKLIPFLGSGFSKPLSLPDFRGLIDGLARKLDYEEELFSLHGTPQQLLEYAKIQHPKEWKEFITDMIVRFNADTVVESRKNSSTHKALAELDLKTIYTTNYDKHVEGALEDANKKCVRYSCLSDFIAEYEGNTGCDVIKFHGSLETPDSIVLTESQYFNRMGLEEAVDQRLRADVLTNGFLFIGYSFNDPNIRYIWYKINELRKRQETGSGEHFKLLPSFIATFGKNIIQDKILEQWNINVISLDPANKADSVTDLLKAIKS